MCLKFVNLSSNFSATAPFTVFTARLYVLSVLFGVLKRYVRIFFHLNLGKQYLSKFGTHGFRPSRTSTLCDTFFAHERYSMRILLSLSSLPCHVNVDVLSGSAHILCLSLVYHVGG